MSDFAGPLAVAGLVLLGFAVLWARQVVYRGFGTQHQDSVRLALSIGGSLMVLVGVLGATAHATYVLAPITCAAVLIVVLMGVLRYRALERRALLRCIAVAAEKGFPLSHAVRGFANERTDELGYRAAVLAEGLEAGMNLPEALRYSKTGLPIEALLAMRLGYETGTLGPAVSRVAKKDEGWDEVARSLFEKYLYLGAMILVMIFCVTFFMIKITPVFQRMFQEFEIELPLITELSIEVSDVFAQLWFLMVPFFAVLCAILIVAGWHYVGALPLDVPGLGWLTRRSDSALVMRCLALAISRHWPLNKTLWMLARIYPKRNMRSRLAVAGRWMDNGADWCDSLRFSGIVNRVDWAVLQAATKVGNAEWALDEMADSSLRRFTYRWRLFLNIVFPVVLLLFGLLELFFVVGFFMPLASLIQGLV